ncbi:hypothetical protein E1B28_010724 [Marasmius oreades]|uniref:HMG box domain-containing protein n=1 Tax=Marasmius oreades TaxID=181124 RepID=A0A9P7UQH1_9AGAR|nr:uncharacterized protein E1B28_010724 [Marasmius oreades]KAG7089011.1 hypothetical protein E1B28_010724 [Marasmius oreades]
MPKASVPKAKTKSEKKVRAPSAWNLYIKANLSSWKDAHPGRPFKDAMAALKDQWQDAPENPNKGKQAKPRAKRNSKDPSTSSEPSRSSPGVSSSDVASSDV